MTIPPKPTKKSVWATSSLPKRTTYTGKVSGRIYKIERGAQWVDIRDIEAHPIAFSIVEPQPVWEQLPADQTEPVSIADENEPVLAQSDDPLIISSDTVSYDAKPTAKKAKKSDDDPTYLD